MPSDDLQIKINTFVEGRNELEKNIEDLKKLLGTVEKGDTVMKAYSKELDNATKALKELDKATAQVKTPEYLAYEKKFNSIGKDIEKTKEKMRGLMVEIDLLADKDDPLRRALDPSRQKELDSYRKQFGKLNADLTELYSKQNLIGRTMGELDKKDKKFEFIDYDKAISQTQKVNTAITSAAEGAKKVQEERVAEEKKAQEEAATSAQAQEGIFKSYSDRITGLNEKLERFGETWKELNGIVSSVIRAQENGTKISGKQFEIFVNGFDKAKTKAQDLVDISNKLASEIFNSESTMPENVFEYLKNGATSALHEANEIDAIMKSIGEDATKIQPIIDIFHQLKDIEEKINAIDIGKAFAFNDKETIQNYNNLITKYNQVYDSYTRLIDTETGSIHVIEQISDSWLGVEQAIDKISRAITKLKGSNVISQDLIEEFNRLKEALIGLKQRSKQYNDEAKKSQGIHNKTSKAVAQHKSQMKSMSDTIRNSKQNFEKMNKVMNNFTNTIKSKLGGGLKTIMKYVLGFRSLFFLVRKIRTMIKEGLDNLVQFESATNETNHQITNLQSSLLYLKNALAAAFAPIINVVLPILNALIDKLADTANAIAMFFARLTGQATVIQAVKVQVQDYADSLKDAGKSAGGAAKKVKDLHDRLAPFDDLQVLGVDKDKDSGGSGSGSGGDDDLSPKIEDMFKRVATEGGLADMIRDAFEKGSLFEVGNLIGEKIKGWFQNIPWVDIKDGLSKGISLVTSFLNGLLTTDGLFETIGRNLAAGFNILVSGIKQFFEEVDWYNIFAGFATGISEFLNDINYEELLMTGIAIAQAIVDGITGFLDKFDIVPAINKFLSALKNATSSKEFSQFIGDTKGLAKKLLKKLDEAIRNIKWEDLSEAIGGIISAAINNITEDDLDLDGSSISYTITHAITWAFVQGIKNNIAFAKPIAQAISNWLGDVFGNVSFAEGYKSFAKGFYSIFSLQGLIKILLTPLKITLSSVLPAIVAAIYEQITGIDIKDKMKQLGEDIWNGMIEGMWNIVKSIPGWIYENLFEPFVEIIKWLFDIGSPSKVMEELGVFVMEGFFNGIKSMVDSITQIFKDIKTNVINKITELKSRATDIWTSIKQGIVNIAMTIKGAVTAPFTNIKDSIIDTMKSLKTSVISIWESLWSGMKNIINDNILAGIEKFCNGVIDGINDVLNLGEVINKLPEKLKEKFELSNYKAPSLSHVEIPRLASGAVIPPNREFLAMLGDQRSGTNIEAPLDTIVEAFRDVMGSMQVETGNQVLQVDGQTFARLMTPYVVSELGRRGYNVKILEA